MPENESNFTPFEPGKVLLPTGEDSKPELPNGKMLQCHVDDVGTDDFGEGPRIAVKFVIDGDGATKGARFTKWFSFKASPNAGFTKLVLAVLGEMPEKLDPSVIKGKPLQVLFSADNFDGKAYQKATYLPPTEGQEVPQTDVVPTDLDSDTDAELAKAMEILGS